MSTHFAEVLASEGAYLTGVTDGAMLACWRHRIVEELMTPQSPYFLAMQQTDEVSERADFLDQWRELIAETVDRLLQSSTTVDAPWSSALAASADVDSQKTAVLILAALHGGSTLSQLAQDPRPLNAALDLALAPFAASEGNCRVRTAIE
ncbi:hypothetical protein ACX3O0_06575 [Homoserinimonas sp. A447]